MGSKDVDECGIKLNTIGTELFYGSDCGDKLYKDRPKSKPRLTPTIG